MKHDNRPEQVLQNEVRGSLDQINSTPSTQEVSDNQSMDDEKVSYEKWLEFAVDYDWWSDTLDYECTELLKKGIYVTQSSIQFNLYNRTISSNGWINRRDFLEHHPEIMQQSPVIYQLLLEGWLDSPSWYSSLLGRRISFDDWNEVWNDDSEFDSGLLAGCNIQTLVDADPVDINNVLETIYEIVEDEHKRILKVLEQEYEYLTSEEAYEAWLECQ